MSIRSELLDVLDRVDGTLAGGGLPVVVFDLDSTLFHTGPRNLRILLDFVAARADRWPDLPELVAGLSADDMGWNVHDCLAKRGMRDREVLEALRDWWLERFFTDEYVVLDEPVSGAPAYVERVHERGALVYYLSGRHVGGMEAGTVRSLKKHGFPFWRGRCAIHLKPSFEMADRAFKDDALADIRSYRGRVVATFENEPGNANMFLHAFPEGRHFLLETVHSPNAEAPAAELVRIPDFA